MAIRRGSKTQRKKASRKQTSARKVRRKKTVESDPAKSATHRILDHPLAREIKRWNEDLDERLEASGAYRDLLNEREQLGDHAVSRAEALFREFIGEQEDGPAQLTVGPQTHESIPWTARQLNAYARRAQRVYEEARDMFGFDLEQIEGVAWLARNFALAKRGVASEKRSAGRKPKPETKLLAELDSLLKPIPATHRRQLVANLMREVARVDAGSPEQIRLRLKDYRRRHPPRRW